MKTVKISLNSIDKVKSFVNDITKFDYDFDLVSGRYVIDAKSIMGIFSLDPTLDITEVDLVEFYGPTPNPDQATMRNVVVFGDAQADRSPCGTGTSAKLATLHGWGELGIGEEFIYESFMGTRFKGVIKEETKIGDYDAVIPMITGSAYLTGVATYLIDSTDPLKYGFLVG